MRVRRLFGFEELAQGPQGFQNWGRTQMTQSQKTQLLNIMATTAVLKTITQIGTPEAA